ncbi:uncharacterized protein LOC124172935 [Ischnura elegans]|nr:uncharacterized protein LOC124172935 [Ischnura elegans]
MGQTASVGMEVLKDPIQVQLECPHQPATSSIPQENELTFVFPEVCTSPSPTPPASPPVPSTSHDPPSSTPKPAGEASKGRGKKRKRERSDDNSTMLDERMVSAVEEISAAMVQMAETFQAVGNEFIEFLRRQ